MKRTFRSNRLSVLLVLVLATSVVAGSCARPTITIQPPTPVPQNQQPGLLGDFGDAPDGDYGMDTGYYGASGGPWVYTYGNIGVGAQFPTMGDDQVPGPYTLDVDEFWIGPLFGVSSPADIPSIEEDADDLNDPDGPPNLQGAGGRADCDKENGTHNPASTGCMPVPPYSIMMNARISIFFGYPPLGIWLTTVHASEDMTYGGPIYWNLALDLNQDGSWNGDNEWVVRDEVINLAPGETKLLISPAFRFPSSGTPWGRLKFPIWVRSMATSESVRDALGSGGWDGRGPDGGFEVGDVEDYFVEWRPIGQILPGPQPIQANGCNINSENLFETSLTDDMVELIPGSGIEGVQFFGLQGVDGGGVAYVSDELLLNEETTTSLVWGEDTFDVSIMDGKVSVEADVGDSGARFLAIPSLNTPNECSGTGPVDVSSVIDVKFNPITGETIVFEAGLFGVTFIVVYDKAGHVTFVGLPEYYVVKVLTGSISITADPPFVNVSGDYDEDTGEFSAAGTGTVAGFPNIAVTFEGTVSADGIIGEYTMGANGGLPGGEPIVYKAEGPLLEEIEAGESGGSGTTETGPAALGSGIEDAIQAFVSVFNSAFEDGNADHLYQLLHPEVIGLYGEESCRAYLDTIIQTPTSLEYVSAIRDKEWIWERDGAAVWVDHAYTVDGKFTANEQTSEQELHLTLPGDDSVRWFTDCGDPLE